MARRVNHIVAKGDNPAWPKGSKSRGFSTTQRYAEVTDKKISKDMDNLMAVRMMYGTGKWYKRQELPKETDFDNGQIG